MTDFWESEYKHSFKWPKMLGSGGKRDAENQVELPVANESIQTTETSPINDEIEVIELESEPTSSKQIKRENAPEVKKAFTPNGPTKTESKDGGLSKEKKTKKPPEMLSYGWANNHPAVPGNFMKTFNVTVPSDQVFQSTTERLGRIDKQKSSKKAVEVIRQPETVIKDAMQQYLEAKKRLEKLQTMYKSEYQNEYVNWAEPLKEIDKKYTAAGLPSDYHDKEKRKVYSKDSKTQIAVVRETASSPTKANRCFGEQIDASASNELYPNKNESESESIKIDSEIPNSPFLNSRTIYDQLKAEESPVCALEKIKPAGISDTVGNGAKEKKHYAQRPSEMQQALIEPDSKLAPKDIPKKVKELETQINSEDKVLMYNIDPPTTWRLAQDLLDRAHKRSQILDKDS